MNALCDLGDGEAFRGRLGQRPRETGIMSAEATWTYGSLEFEAWIEADSPLANPAPEVFENGEFDRLMRQTPTMQVRIAKNSDGVFRHLHHDKTRLELLRFISHETGPVLSPRNDLMNQLII